MSFNVKRLPSTFVPGDIGIAHIAISNQGGTAIDGEATVQLLLSPDTTVSNDDVPINVQSFQSLRLNLDITDSLSRTAVFTIPQTITPGNYNLLAEIVPISGITNDELTPPQSVVAGTAALSFGNVGNRHNVRLPETLNPGVVSFFILQGPGTGTFFNDGT